MVSLMEVKDILNRRGAMKEQDLVYHFRSTPEMIQMICEKLQQKGLIEPFTTGGGEGCCGGQHSFLESLEGGCSCSTEPPARAWRWVAPHK